MDYKNCHFCKARLTTVNLDYIFWCDETCMETHRKQRQEKFKKDNEMHNPPARRGEVDHTNAIMQNIIKRGDVEEAPDGKPKSGRKCGNCGESGHNARTCKK